MTRTTQDAPSDGPSGIAGENLPGVDTEASARCPGRKHRRHVLAVCEGSCCTACGGPIDIDGGCRCYP